MHLKFILTLFLLIAVLLPSPGQTAGELFVRFPELKSLALNTSDRLDLIDLYKAGEKATVKNRFGDSCSILRLTDDYLQIQTGKSQLELFILPMINDSKIVGLIHTVCAPVCDSYLEFYTTAGKKLRATAFISIADKSDFLKKGINREDEKVKNALVPLDISLMRFHYDSDKQELRQYYHTPDYLSESEKELVKPYLNENPKRYQWNLMRFE
jgi:hypothetical protein